MISLPIFQCRALWKTEASFNNVAAFVGFIHDLVTLLSTAVLTKDVKPIVMEVMETTVMQSGEAMEV